ncbi:MAG: gluconate transporter, partial [Gloeobacteraceae cyanobacterium ES-bin-316]|nr:gluconate transporter [Ferruginibacter sp.]
YNVGFVLLVPLVFSVTYRTGLPAVYTALPMLAALSVTHGFLPPHPSPSAIAVQLQADAGRVLLYGLLVAIPAVIVAGPVFAQTIKNITTKPLDIFQTAPKSFTQVPGAANSFLSALLPALLLIVLTALPFVVPVSGKYLSLLAFLSDPIIVLLFALLFATWSLGIAQKIPVPKVMGFYADAVKDVAPILLIVAGAGALKQVFTDSGVSLIIAQRMQDLALNPLLLGWLLAAVIRVCVGSATVAGLTAAGIIAPVIISAAVNPNLMVLSIGAGSLFFSHVNDSGFWMFKEYFNLSLKDTLRSWSVMETIVSVMGLLGVLLLDVLL